MKGDIAATYSLIYHFLKQQSQNEAAGAVKKAAKPFVVLRDDIEQKGPPLEDIVKEWNAKSKSTVNPGDTNSSSEDSESSDDTSSDSEDSSSSDSRKQESEDTSGPENKADNTSDSDDTSDDMDEDVISKKLPRKPERDTSATLSSAGENARGVAHQVAQTLNKSTEDKNKSSESETSDSDSSDSDNSSNSSSAESSSSSSGSPSNSDLSDEEEENVNQQPTEVKSESSSESSSDSDESDSESEQKEDTCMAKVNKVAIANSTSESSSESEHESDTESQQEEDMHVAKKCKISESKAVRSQQIARTEQKKEKPPPRVKERFQRVKVHNLAPELLLNNGYQARGGAVNDYGERAHRDLIVTRGVGFRKEKNKKKRGSYRGGDITMENHSIKFSF